MHTRSNTWGNQTVLPASLNTKMQKYKNAKTTGSGGESQIENLNLNSFLRTCDSDRSRLGLWQQASDYKKATRGIFVTPAFRCPQESQDNPAVSAETCECASIVQISVLCALVCRHCANRYSQFLKFMCKQVLISAHWV